MTRGTGDHGTHTIPGTEASASTGTHGSTTRGTGDRPTATGILITADGTEAGGLA